MLSLITDHVSYVHNKIRFDSQFESQFDNLYFDSWYHEVFVHVISMITELEFLEYLDSKPEIIRPKYVEL